MGQMRVNLGGELIVTVLTRLEERVSSFLFKVSKNFFLKQKQEISRWKLVYGKQKYKLG